MTTLDYALLKEEETEGLSTTGGQYVQSQYFHLTWKGTLAFALFATLYSVTLVFVTLKLAGLNQPSLLRNSLATTSYQAQVEKHITFQPQEFSEREWPSNETYFSKPSEEVDKNWHELVEFMNMRIPPDAMEELGQTDQSIELPDGNYLGNFMVFHRLHCLKHIYHALHPEYYGPKDGSSEKGKIYQDVHIGHCMHLLKQAVMCHGDTTIVTQQWAPNGAFWVVNYSAPHQCVNWDSLMEWVKPRAFNATAEGVLVHPEFGPVVANGSIASLEGL